MSIDCYFKKDVGRRAVDSYGSIYVLHADIAKKNIYIIYIILK